MMLELARSRRQLQRLVQRWRGDGVAAARLEPAERDQRRPARVVSDVGAECADLGGGGGGLGPAATVEVASGQPADHVEAAMVQVALGGIGEPSVR